MVHDFISSCNGLGLIDVDLPYDDAVAGTGDTEADKPAAPHECLSTTEASNRSLSYDEQAEEFLNRVLSPLRREQMAQQGTVAVPVAGDGSAISTFLNSTPAQCHGPPTPLFVSVPRETWVEITSAVHKLHRLLPGLLPDNTMGLNDGGCHPVLTMISCTASPPTLAFAQPSSRPSIIICVHCHCILISEKTPTQPAKKSIDLPDEAASTTRQMSSMLNSPHGSSSPSDSQHARASYTPKDTPASLSAAGRLITPAEVDDCMRISPFLCSTEPPNSTQFHEQFVRAGTEELFDSGRLQLLYPLVASPPLSLVALPVDGNAAFDTHPGAVLDVTEEDGDVILAVTPEARSARNSVGICTISKSPELEDDGPGSLVRPSPKLTAAPQEVSYLDDDPSHPPFDKVDDSLLRSTNVCKIEPEIVSCRRAVTFELASAAEQAFDPQIITLGTHVIALDRTVSTAAMEPIADTESTYGAAGARGQSSPDIAFASDSANGLNDVIVSCFKRMEMRDSLADRLFTTVSALTADPNNTMTPPSSSSRPIKDRISFAPLPITPPSSPDSFRAEGSYSGSSRKRNSYDDRLRHNRPVRRPRTDTEERARSAPGAGRTTTLLSRIGPAPYPGC